MGENGDSVLKVVQLFIDNINESTKSTSKELDRLSGEVGGVKTKINTPPRNEELSEQIQKVDDKADVITISLTGINSCIKSMITSVRVAAIVMGFAIIIASGITQCGKYIDCRNIKQEVDKYLIYKDKEKSSGITSETDG
jgi:hypothetical protein